MRLRDVRLLDICRGRPNGKNTPWTTLSDFLSTLITGSHHTCCSCLSSAGRTPASMSAKEPALKKSRSSAVKTLNSLTKSWLKLLSPAIRFSIASVATRSSGPAFLCSLFYSKVWCSNPRVGMRDTAVPLAPSCSQNGSHSQYRMQDAAQRPGPQGDHLDGVLDLLLELMRDVVLHSQWNFG